MEISHRLSHIISGGSDGWEVFYRARKMIAQGIPVTELNIGEHDIRTDQSILDAMQQSARAGHTGYATVPGIPALRQAVAARISARSGVPTGPENILITPGGQSALFACHHATCDQGDVALYIDPYYVTYPGTIRSLGAVPRAIVTDPAQNFQPSYDAIAAACQDGKAKSLLINTPNNPTGMVYDAATMDQIARACRDFDLWLISDEVYDSQVWDGHHISPRILPDMGPRCLVVGSMSKSHAMTGSRIGWVCGPASVIAQMTNLSTHTTYGVPGYIQDAAVFALSQGTRAEAKVAAPFLRRRALTLKVLAGQNLIRAVPVRGAMYAMLDIRATGLTGEAFANALLDAEKIAVMPGESFGQAAAGHIRVAMTIDDDAYVAALTRLLRFAQQLAQA
jgi:arginine:pyruvate transaminase